MSDNDVLKFDCCLQPLFLLLRNSNFFLTICSVLKSLPNSVKTAILQ